MTEISSASRASRRYFMRLAFGRLTFISVALLLALLFLAFHLLGWRDDTAIFSGTSTGSDLQAASVRGILYALSYFCVIVAGPVLIIAAGIHAGLLRIARLLKAPSFRAER